MSIKELISQSLKNFSKSLSKVFIKKSDIVNDLSSSDTDKPQAAYQGKVLSENIDTLNSNISRYGSEEAFVSFTYFGDYWWCSSPIPLMNASDLTIIISDDLKNVTGDRTTSIPSTYFEIRKNKDFFYILTNDQSTAGYTFNTLLPNRMWNIKYEILKLSA